jgi:hypothetical protein
MDHSVHKYTVHPGEKLVLSAAVSKIEPAGTPIIVEGEGIDPTFVTGEEIFDAEGAAGLRLTATKTARVWVTTVEDGELDGENLGDGAPDVENVSEGAPEAVHRRAERKAKSGRKAKKAKAA